MLPKLKPNILLAKSFEPGQFRGSYTLAGHTADVVNSVTTIVDTLGDRLIEQFGLTCSFAKLRATARLAAYLHDWGKANDHFQGMVRFRMDGASPQRNSQHFPQMYRHEVISASLAWEFRDWLSQGEGDFYTALVAAGGHHLKLGGRGGERTDNFGEHRQSGDDRMYFFTVGDPQFETLLRYGQQHLSLPQKLKLSQRPSVSLSSSEIKARQKELLRAFEDWEEDAAFVATVKSLLVAGDSSGSAIANTDEVAQKWIKAKLEHTLTEERLQTVISDRLGEHSLRQFQAKLGNSTKRVTLARAGCGTGKTLGAYNWAKTYALGRKLFFCYPTTGTSTEGFIDYVHDKIDAILFHSRANVDLEMMKTGEEADAGDNCVNESEQKLESFKAWGQEAVVCTVDTVLGWLQCNRKPMYCFPAIAQAAFVFDEVHCYDAKLFGALLRFLETVKAPMLLMSASFLPWQLEAIKKAVGEPIEVIEGPKDLEEKPRYRFQLLDEPDWKRVEQELADGGKVLWVCNQVNTAIDVYRKAKARNLNVLLYHSRYRYKDRVDEHHRAVVAAFKPEQTEPVLAIATQVAEMSLDLSATLLVSQVADPAGLIQRLGRLNRRYCGNALDALFYPDEKVGFPYSEADLGGGEFMIRGFADEVSQAQLAKWLENRAEKGEPDKNSVMLDGQWRTYPTSLREAGYNVTALLEDDLEEIKQRSAKEIPSFTVPLPSKGVEQWKRYKIYPIAPRDKWAYSAEVGAFDMTK
ncbi:MAG: CRISPR-associated helicase Cas3' [Elainellaceae cyanobacterium]